MSEISNLINQNNWTALVNQYEPKTLIKDLSFKEGMALAYKLLFNEEMDDDLRDYATELLEEIRQAYPKEWAGDWKNDVFLGDACYLTMKYDERYKAYKRAYEKVALPPPSLLISLASCYLSPDPPINLEDAEKLAKKALEEEISIEGVVLLRGIYAEKKDYSKFDYWDNILREIEKKDMHTKDAWPDFSNF